MNRRLFVVIFLAHCLLVSCGTVGVKNPSFPVSRGEADKVLEQMEADKKPLERPVLVLSGFLDPGLAAESIRDDLLEVATGGPVIVASFATEGDFDGARDTLIRELEEVLPSGDPNVTVEVDVIGHSMGGLIARYASLPNQSGKRLKVRRLFTIATPHRGAAMGGGALPLNDLAADMDEDSKFIAKMENEKHDYPIYPYVMLGDQVVGAENASPPGVAPWWVDRNWFAVAHLAVPYDERILADVFRRLRGEEALTTEPRAGLPE